ncbi:MAG TPA: ATP-binding protein [Polyangiaceae bacterium]|nr:ATP-binding protein [Polyangiaceae bacterium]
MQDRASDPDDSLVYRTAIERAPLPIMRVSASKGRYVFFNDAFATMLGHTRESLAARDPYEAWMESAHPDDVDAERAAMGRVASGETDTFELEKRVLRKDGEARWVRMTASATRDAQGRLDCLTAYFTDIHEQRALAGACKHLQTQLVQEQKLGAVGKLAGGVAHEFNNRLVVIMGYGELLRRDLPAGSPAAQKTDFVLASAKRAAELTRQLLAYSRKQVLTPRSFDMNAMTHGMTNLLKSVLGDSIEVSTALEARREAMADPGQIEQVILNLALNARDAMASGGKLRLETRDTTVGPGDDPELPPGHYVTLRVADTGSGIPEEILRHVFEPFFTTKPMGHGTGLGLSTVEGIVRQSGGAVRVESRVGAGTTFTIHLPYAAAPSPAPPSLEDAPPGRGRFETVLVCDDDDAVRGLLVAVLGLRAYRVLAAGDGQRALDLARRNDGSIDLLVTDIAMPGLGGIELSLELRKRYPRMKTLFVSGYAEDSGRLSTPPPGVHFLPKPFLPGDLTRMVATLLEGEERPPRQNSQPR